MKALQRTRPVCASHIKMNYSGPKSKKEFSDESTEHEVTLKGQEQYQVETFSVIIDKLVIWLDHWVDAYHNISNRFEILLNMESEDLPTVCKQADALCNSYHYDLNQSLTDEIIQFRCFVER